MTQPYNRLTTLDAVSAGTTATALLTADQQAMMGLRGAVIQPEGEVRLGGPEITATKGIKLAKDQIYDLTHFAGPVYVIATGASAVDVQVTLGAV